MLYKNTSSHKVGSPIFKLPNELLDPVFDQPSLTMSGRKQVALTCTRFRFVLQRLILQEIVIDYEDLFKRSQEKHNQLRNFLGDTHNTEQASLIKKYTIEASWAYNSKDATEASLLPNRLLLKSLFNLPQLHTIIMQYHTQGYTLIQRMTALKQILAWREEGSGRTLGLEFELRREEGLLEGSANLDMLANLDKEINLLKVSILDRKCRPPGKRNPGFKTLMSIFQLAPWLEQVDVRHDCRCWTLQDVIDASGTECYQVIQRCQNDVGHVDIYGYES